MPRKTNSLTIFLLFFAFWCAVSLLSWPDYKQDLFLKNNFKTAMAEVVAVYPKNHNTCLYIFSENNREYKGLGRHCGDFFIDDEIQIYYSPENPEISANEHPSKLVKNHLKGFLISLIMWPLFAVYLGYKGIFKLN